MLIKYTGKYVKIYCIYYKNNIFWRHRSNISCAASCTFVLIGFCFGSKVTGAYHASLLETLRD